MKKVILTLLMLVVLSSFVSASPDPVDFVSKIRASGGDYNKLSDWESAIQSDLTASSSKVFSISNIGSYNAGDDGSSVTFTGGGTGILKHISTYDKAYIVSVSGSINTGTVSISGSGHTFTISDTGNQIGAAVAECYDDWPSGLEDFVHIEGWTTSSDHYVKIYAPQSERHKGKWGDGFKIVGASGILTISVRDDYAKIEGIQVRGGKDGIHVSILSNGLVEIEDCIAKGNDYGFDLNSKAYVRNTISFDNTYEGFWISGGKGTRLYNCDAIDNSRYGFYVHGSTTYCGNCLATGNVKDFSGTGTPTLENCASGDGTADDFLGSNNRVDQTFTFVDEVNDDFHLASDDVGARDYGKDFSADAYYPFSIDIDGQTRSGNWDIGADEIWEEQEEPEEKDYYTKEEIDEMLENYYTKEEVDEKTSILEGIINRIITYLKYLSKGLRKKMVCGYMTENELDSYEDLGLSCEIKRGKCRCN